jgi:hypothetical protein
MTRLFRKDVLIGLLAALLALLVVGLPVLAMTIQSDACFQFPQQCDKGYGFEIALVAVFVAFMTVWWAAARGVRWWTGNID